MRSLPVLVAAAVAAGAGLGFGLPLGRVPGALTVSLCAGAATWRLRRGAARAVLAWSVCGFLVGTWTIGSADDAGAREPVLAHTVEGRTGPVRLSGRLSADSTLGADGPRLRLTDVAVVDAGRAAPYPGDVSLGIGGSLALGRYHQWRRGRTVAVAATVHRPARYLDLGVGDDRLALARRGLVLVGSVKSGALVDVVSNAGWAGERAADARAFVRRAIAAHVAARDPTAGAIATAILIGDRTGLDPVLEDRLQAAGTYHVIAISGGNIAILAATLLALAWLVRAPMRAAQLIVAAVLWLYAGLVDGGASVTRATTMASVYLVLRAMDLRAGALQTLAMAVSIMLATTPLVAADPGFLLTVGATAAIVVLAGAIAARGSWPPAVRPVVAVVAASVATEVVLLPVSARLFGRVTVAGPLLNLIAVPAMALVQQAGLAVVALAAWWRGAADWAGWLTVVSARVLVGSSLPIAWMPWLAVRVPAPAPWAIALYYVALASALGAPRWTLLPGALRVRLRRLGAAGLLAAAAWIVAHPSTWRWPWRADGLLHIVSLDVGQGDSTLIRLPDQSTVLVDTGGLGVDRGFDIGARVVAPALWALGVGRLDALLLTHGDPDHIGGAPTVIDVFRPRRIWDGIVVPSHEPMARLRDLARADGLTWEALRAGGSWSHAGVTFHVWNPPSPDWERPKVRNDDSVVLELRYGDVSVVLPGDIGAEVERAIGPRIPPARLRVLKLAHHGSATSTSDAFLDALRPIIGHRQLRTGEPVRPSGARGDGAAGGAAHPGRADGRGG